MPDNKPHTVEFDWRLTTFEGSRREQLRRWAQLPLENILLAIEEMEDLAGQLSAASGSSQHDRLKGLNVSEPSMGYGATGGEHDLPLPGCTPEPLMAYLKALGILRLVSEQKDQQVRGWWKNDVFWVRSPVLFNDAATEEARREALITFFLQEYQPTPIVVPWSGNDFFNVKWECPQCLFSKTPTASSAIEAILATRSHRFESYRKGLQSCKEALESCGIDTKGKMEKQKWTLIEMLRSRCAEPRMLDWMDAAAITGIERFAALLGSGGGSDGNTHFSDNFMQNLWDVLPDFDDQRPAKKGQAGSSVVETSRRRLGEALFAVANNDRVINRTSSLFDSGAVGGPNATQGMERDSLSNPWDIILALEGTVSFAGSATKRLTTNAAAQAAFPFQVSASVTIDDGLADKEQVGAEIWLPFWSRPTCSEDVLTLLREGRAQCGSRPARSGVDMARAIVSLGIDRGIRTFARYAIVKGRVGGDNYNTATALGRFDVVEHSGADLLREIDRWLDEFRWKCARGRDKEEAPKRILSTLTGIDSAIFEYCKYGGPLPFQKIVIALGRAERELAVTQGQFKRKTVKPISLFSSVWTHAADDQSPEFAIARALMSVHDQEGKIGPVRSNLEPVDWKQRCRAWAEKDRAVVWNAEDLYTNLASVLQRRMMDGHRVGCHHLPLASTYSASLDAVAGFLDGDLDEQRVMDLVWGLMLIEHRGIQIAGVYKEPYLPMARTYALLKLLFLPRSIVPDRAAGKLSWRLARNSEAGISIRPEPRILSLLQAGRVGEACSIAAQRLRISGLTPMPGGLPDGKKRDTSWSEYADSHRVAQRLAAALLIPIGSHDVNRLIHLVCRDEQAFALT